MLAPATDVMYDYRTNPPHYPEWQAAFRQLGETARRLQHSVAQQQEALRTLRQQARDAWLRAPAPRASLLAAQWRPWEQGQRHDLFEEQDTAVPRRVRHGISDCRVHKVPDEGLHTSVHEGHDVQLE